MNPDRIRGIEPQNRHPVARLALATFIAVGSSTYVPLLEKLASWFPTTPVGEAFTPNCRTGLGVTVDNKDFSKGVRVIVVEDLSGRKITDRRLRVGEEVRVEFTGPSNTRKAGQDARRFVYFTTNTDGQIVFSREETTVTCGSFEHLNSKAEEETQKRETPTPSRTATPTSGSTPSPIVATPTPDTRDARIATLEAQVAQQRRIDATATRAAENEQLEQKVRTAVATEARAAIEAERRATATVVTLIKEAEQRGVAQAIAAVQAMTATATAQAVEQQRTRREPAPDLGTILQSNLGWLAGVMAVGAAAFGSISVWRRRHPAAAPPAPPAAPAAPGPGPGGPAVP